MCGIRGNPLDMSDTAAIFPHMSKNGNARVAAAARKGPKKRREPTTERGRRLLAFFDSKGLSIRAVAVATGMHSQTIVRAIHNDPGAQSVATLDALLRIGVPPELLGRAG